MNITEALIQAVAEIVTMFGINASFQREEAEQHLTSANQVNVLVGFSNSLTGNMVLELDKSSALLIISAMMGGMEVTNLDEMARSGLGEILNMIAGTTFRKVQPHEITDLSPPTIVTGNNVFLMISRIQSNKILFQFDNPQASGAFTISYSMEKASA